MIIPYSVTLGEFALDTFLSETVVYIRERDSVRKLIGVIKSGTRIDEIAQQTKCAVESYLESSVRSPEPSDLEAWLFGGNAPFVGPMKYQGRIVQVLQDAGSNPQILLALDGLGIGATIAQPTCERRIAPLFTYTKSLNIFENGSFKYVARCDIGPVPQSKGYEFTEYDLR